LTVGGAFGGGLKTSTLRLIQQKAWGDGIPLPQVFAVVAAAVAAVVAAVAAAVQAAAAIMTIMAS